MRKIGGRCLDFVIFPKNRGLRTLKIFHLGPGRSLQRGRSSAALRPGLERGLLDFAIFLKNRGPAIWTLKIYGPPPGGPGASLARARSSAQHPPPSRGLLDFAIFAKNRGLRTLFFWGLLLAGCLAYSLGLLRLGLLALFFLAYSLFIPVGQTLWPTS